MTEKYKLSNQAIGSLMLVVQNSIKNVMAGKVKEECDVSLMLKEFELENSDDGLVVNNPPTVDYTNDDYDEEEDVDLDDYEDDGA